MALIISVYNMCMTPSFCSSGCHFLYALPERDHLTRLDLPDNDNNEQDLLRIYDSGLENLFEIIRGIF
jgi:hypothetical protein